MHLSVDAMAIAHLRQQVAAISQKVRTLADKSVRKRALQIENLAKQKAAVDTGYLRSTIGVTNGDLIAVIGAHANYAAYVEYGTAKMGPRPYMGPAFETVRPLFEADIDDLMKDPLR